ncbi:Zinc finger ccch domain-containing protein 42, partial [Globisporangium splendens]
MRDNDSQKIIVVGIPKTMDDSALSELFSGFGTVADAKVVLDANMKQSRGFGFVTFTAGSAMRKAIQEMNKKVVEGRTLNVRQLVPKDKFQAEKKDDASQDPSKRPCWLLRKGKCTKGDQCPFSHEIKDGEFGSCFEFMQTGECKRGDKCIFSHSSRKDDAESNESESTQAKPREAPVKQEGGEQKRVCFAFQKGKCHRGKKCLYLHEKVPEMVNDQPVVPATKQEAAPAKRGEFEVVAPAEVGKKRSRDVDSHDDDDGNEQEGDDESEDDNDEEDEEEEQKPQQKAVPARVVPLARASGQSKPAEKRPRNEDAKPFEKRQRSENGKPFVKREYPAKNGDGKDLSKYGGNGYAQRYTEKQLKQKKQNNKNALQRQNAKNRPKGPQQVQPQRPKRAEVVDMGAAFDSDDDRKPRGKKRVVDKAQQKANREKLQQERKAKRDAKKNALSRLQTKESIEL